jgi:hypothetical protein
MEGLRQILRVSWTSRKTNDWGLQEAGTDRMLLSKVKKRKLQYFGHIMRREGECIEKQMIQGTLGGSRRRGRPRARWFDNIIDWMNLEPSSLIRMTSNRNAWRTAVHEATEPCLGDGWNRTEQNVEDVKYGHATRLEDDSSILAAELSAIFMAVEWLKANSTGSKQSYSRTHSANWKRYGLATHKRGQTHCPRH